MAVCHNPIRYTMSADISKWVRYNGIWICSERTRHGLGRRKRLGEFQPPPQLHSRVYGHRHGNNSSTRPNTHLNARSDTMSEKNLSTSTLSLRFMQNAYRAKQLAQVEAEQARVKDEAEWEVSKEVKEAWGIGTRSNETE